MMFRPPRKSSHLRSTGLSCLVCNSTEIAYRHTLAGYDVFRCAACGFQFVSPTPTAQELANYYDQSYSVPLERYARHAGRNESRIADMERWLPGRGRLLE